MRLILIPALLSALLLTSCAQGATLRLHATAPTMLNAGTCPLPIFTLARTSWPMQLHFAWSGPSAGEDSVSCTPGQGVDFARSVIAGAYQVRAWPSNPYGAGCDTTITKLVGDPPGKPTELR